MSRPRGHRRSDRVPSPLSLLAELRPAVDALRRARDDLTIDGALHRAVGAVEAALRGLAAALGHPRHFDALDHLSAPARLDPIIRARPEPALPSMAGPTACDVVEEDDGTYAVTWADTGRVVEMDGVAQRGLTVDRADAVADLLEAPDQIAAGRGGRSDG